MDKFEQYGNVEFGDNRLSKRLVRLLGQLAGNPTASISAACQNPYQAKAAYRFTANDNVTAEAITQISQDVTLGNINAHKPPVLLILQDTSEINYSGLKATDGLGSMGAKKSSLGIISHTAVAVGESGEIYGLLAQKLWTRPPELFGQSNKRNWKLPIEEKESYKWLETLEKIGTPFPEGTRAVHVCDREGDFYEFFYKAEIEQSQYLCRRCYERNIEEEDGMRKLNDLVKVQPVAGTISIHIPRDSHTKREARDAEVEIKFGKSRIRKSSRLKSNEDLPKSIEVYYVTVDEVEPPQGQEKIFWQLITNVPTESFEDAVTLLQWYTQRWKIETFHKTLKSGCKIEELQAETADKLKKLIAIYSILALQIMLLSNAARTQSDESCELYLTEDEWKILYRVAKKTKTLPEKPPTVHDAVVMIAKLGGFLARKSDGFPGVTVIWRGLTSFYAILDAVPFLN